MAVKKNTNLVLVFIVVILLVLCIGAGAYFVWNGNQISASSHTRKSETSKMVDQVSYVNIAHPFLFNVTGDQRNRLVQINVQLMVRGESNVELARYHLPLIESSLMSTFASSTVEQLLASNGRSELGSQAGDDIKASLMTLIGQPVIEKVLFTDFVIQ